MSGIYSPSDTLESGPMSGRSESVFDGLGLGLGLAHMEIMQSWEAPGRCLGTPDLLNYLCSAVFLCACNVFSVRTGLSEGQI